MFVKICGITSEDDALLAVALGADAVGFVFAPSPRQIAPQIAADIVKRLPPEVISVGVFRDAAPQRVSDVAHAAGLKAVQLHGHEPPEVAKWLHTRLPMVIQAFSATDDRVARADDYGATAVLLDAPEPGSGQVFDWSLAARVPRRERVIIAGGLDPSNVAAAIARARPWGVDVASGVERRPGHKDPIKLREFIQAARAAFERIDRLEGFDRLGEPDEWDGADGEGGEGGRRGALYDWQEDG